MPPFSLIGGWGPGCQGADGALWAMVALAMHPGSAAQIPVALEAGRGTVQ
jgi:hypothetical protein